jgi:hypothetical protein
MLFHFTKEWISNIDKNIFPLPGTCFYDRTYTQVGYKSFVVTSAYACQKECLQDSQCSNFYFTPNSLCNLRSGAVGGDSGIYAGHISGPKSCIKGYFLTFEYMFA